MRIFNKVKVGITTYRISEELGWHIRKEIVRPLPPLLPNGRIDWQAEYANLLKDTTMPPEGTEERDVYDCYEDIKDYIGKGWRGACIYYSMCLLDYIKRLPSEAFDPKPEEIPPEWCEEVYLHYYGSNKHIPRLRFIGTRRADKIEGYETHYPKAYKRETATIYRCTCGRFVIIPKRAERRLDKLSDCGCKGAKRSRDFNMWREWVTILMTAEQEGVEVKFNISQFKFWYEYMARLHRPSPYFVERVNGAKDFELDNMILSTGGVDNQDKFGYIRI